MLRVGLTGGLGSGKTTVARIFRRLGAPVMEADEVARQMMQPDEPVFQEIVRVFGPTVVQSDGALNRRALAAMAFGQGRLAELNAIVHPPVIAAQQQWMETLSREQHQSIAVYETALLFEASETPGTQDWKSRFDWRVLVTAPEAMRVARYVARMAGAHSTERERQALEDDARRRMAAQMPEEEKMRLSDTVLRNDASLEELTKRTEALYDELRTRAKEHV